MNAITNATSVASVSRGFDAAIDAFDSYLGGVILAQSAEYGVSRPISALLLLQKIGAAYRSAAFVVDDKGRGESGALSVCMTHNAVDICHWLADEFECVVVPAADVPLANIDALTVRDALCEYVGATGEDRITRRTLYAKTQEPGLNEARTDAAIDVLHAWGWVRFPESEPDVVIELSPYFFNIPPPS
jgi:hypothetical protein